MSAKQRLLKPLAHAIYNRGLVGGLSSYLKVLREFRRYRRAAGASERVSFKDFFPWPIDRYDSAGDAGMYFYQDTWCADRLRIAQPKRHVDVGSSMTFLAMALQLSDVLYVDVRPISIRLPRFTFARGDLVDLPFATGSFESLSSLSVVEHVGLGRYGDALDPNGTNKACAELARVLRPGGTLYVAVPTEARSSTHFNAHRIFEPEEFKAKFGDLVLADEQYALADRMVCRCEYDELGKPYAFGCFQFTKGAALG